MNHIRRVKKYTVREWQNATTESNTINVLFDLTETAGRKKSGQSNTHSTLIPTLVEHLVSFVTISVSAVP